ncbi:MAG TPA: YkvA family protein [Woeseiaceae bacterium]|nr:YkvA family protein [Woeseiaceae bacterium]
MGISISLDFTDRDLGLFRDAVRQSRNTVRDGDEAEIIDAVRTVLESIRTARPLPDFVSKRLPELDTMISMLEDADWRLPKAAREQMLATFVYFGDPEDVIPDGIPAIGFLDDVILLELLLRDFRHVREAYSDFCRFRKAYDRKNGERGGAAGRKKSLDARRKNLLERMKRRQARDKRPALR